MRKYGLVLMIASLLALLVSGTATANNFGATGDRVGNTTAFNCASCHGGGVMRAAGPHGGYTTTTKRCSTCHTIHSNIADNGRIGQSAKLLPGTSITAVCNYCHDLTGSVEAPYYTNYMTNDHELKSAHKVQGGINYWTGGRAVGAGTLTNPEVAGAVYSLPDPAGIIPGGSSATGGTLPYADFFKQGEWSAGNFTCDSCHTPHAINGQAVAPYFGESRRKDTGNYIYAGTRLLKQKLYVAQTTPITEYGSAWCAGCHQGRLTMVGADVYNHPVNGSGLGYNFGSVVYNTVEGSTPVPNVFAAVPGLDQAAKITSINSGVTTGDAASGTITKVLAYGAEGTTNVNGSVVDRYLSSSPRINSWYAMTPGDATNLAEPNKARPDGYIPISVFRNPDLQNLNGPSCQQCHASSRDVESAFSEDRLAGGVTFSFPHVSTTQYLLVEDNDDLCTNCHGLDNLP